MTATASPRGAGRAGGVRRLCSTPVRTSTRHSRRLGSRRSSSRARKGTCPWCGCCSPAPPSARATGTDSRRSTWRAARQHGHRAAPPRPRRRRRRRRQRRLDAAALAGGGRAAGRGRRAARRRRAEAALHAPRGGGVDGGAPRRRLHAGARRGGGRPRRPHRRAAARRRRRWRRRRRRPHDAAPRRRRRRPPGGGRGALASAAAGDVEGALELARFEGGGDDRAARPRAYAEATLGYWVRAHLAALEAELGGTHEARTGQVVAFFPTTIRRAFSTMSQLGIRIEY